MADPSRPEDSGAPYRDDAPAGEGPTKAFRLKLDNWMEELLKKDLDPDAPAEAAPAEPEPQPPKTTGGDPPAPPVPAQPAKR
jgi:hypothetical protein